MTDTTDQSRRAQKALLPPDVLADARHDRTHENSGRLLHASPILPATDPREGRSDDYPICEDECVTWGGHADNCRVPAAIRALEAKAAAAEAALQELLARIHRDGGHYAAEHGLEKATEDADAIVAEVFADCDHWKRSFDNMAGQSLAEQRIARGWQETAEKFRGERDRLAGEVERLTNERDASNRATERQWEAASQLRAEVARLTSELEKARENEARYLWLRSSDQEQVEVFAHYTLDALDAAIDAARRAGEGEK